MKAIVYSTFAAALILTACSTNNKQFTDEDAQVATDSVLIKRLQGFVEAKQVAFGHHDDPVYGHNWSYQPDSSDVKNVTGSYPAIFDWDLGLIEWGMDKQLDGVPFELIRSKAQEHHANGGFNSFSWHLRNPVTKGDSWDVTQTGVIAEILKPETPLNDTIRTWLCNAADFIASITDEQGAPIPVIFRPWHENTGSWFWWGEKLCTPQEYKDLWKLTREVFDAKGVDNVVWAYSPGTEVKTVEQYAERYPGDELVDIVGVDCYDFIAPDGTTYYTENLRAALDNLCSFATEHGKVAALTETGLESLKDSTWFTGKLWPVIKDYPIAYVTVWRNAWDKPDHYYAPYPGHPSAADFVRFYNLPETIFLSDLQTAD